MDRIHAAAAAADLLVLNGDIFDFRWSEHGTVQRTADAASGWVRALAHDHRDCQFMVIAGNHDNVPAYFEALDTLASEVANVSWTQYLMRLGSKVFLHGDVANRTMTQTDLERFRQHCEGMRPLGRGPNVAYDVATAIGLHRVVPHLIPRPVAMRRLLAYLGDALPSGADDVRDVYFGHTHAPFEEQNYRGVRFHNAGAAIKGMPMRFIGFEFDEAVEALL